MKKSEFTQQLAFIIDSATADGVINVDLIVKELDDRKLIKIPKHDCMPGSDWTVLAEGWEPENA